MIVQLIVIAVNSMVVSIMDNGAGLLPARASWSWQLEYGCTRSRSSRVGLMN